MSETKELLEATVKGLQDLEDANKPVISSTVMNVVNDAINYAVENYNFDNADSYELEFNLDYDNKIQAENINLTDTYELVEAIVTNVEKQFKIEQDDETND